MRTIDYVGHKIMVDKNGLDFYDNTTNRKLSVYTNKTISRHYLNIGSVKVYCYRLVAMAYPEICGGWFDGCEVHHIDRNTLNDRVENLKVLDPKEHHNEHIEESISNLPEYSGQNDKPVYQYSLDGEFIAKWCSSAAAGRILGISGDAISKAARGESDTSGNYQWRYFDDDAPLFIKPILSGLDRIIIGNYTPVSQYTKSGEWVCDYDSMKEAAESIGVNNSGNITSCANGLRKSAYGYVWRYKNVS